MVFFNYIYIYIYIFLVMVIILFLYNSSNRRSDKIYVLSYGRVFHLYICSLIAIEWTYLYVTYQFHK